MNAATAEFEVRHHCQRQSVLKTEKHLSSSVEQGGVESCIRTATKIFCGCSYTTFFNAPLYDGAREARAPDPYTEPCVNLGSRFR